MTRRMRLSLHRRQIVFRCLSSQSASPRGRFASVPGPRLCVGKEENSMCFSGGLSFGVVRRFSLFLENESAKSFSCSGVRRALMRLLQC